MPRQGFACCDCQYKHAWSNGGNFGELPMIPAGTAIEVLSYGSNRAYVKVDGKPMRLGHDYGRDQESPEAWVGKIGVNENPRTLVGPYPPPIQEAVPAGKLMRARPRRQPMRSTSYGL